MAAIPNGCFEKRCESLLVVMLFLLITVIDKPTDRNGAGRGRWEEEKNWASKHGAPCELTVCAIVCVVLALGLRSGLVFENRRASARHMAHLL